MSTRSSRSASYARSARSTSIAAKHSEGLRSAPTPPPQHHQDSSSSAAEGRPSSHLSVLREFFSYTNTTLIHKAAGAIAVALLAGGYGIGFGVGSSAAQSAADASVAKEIAIFNEWQVLITTTFTKAASLASVMGGFALANADGPMDWSQVPYSYFDDIQRPSTETDADRAALAAQRALINSTAARIRVFQDDRYQLLGKTVFMDGLLSLGVLAGGVVSQFYPQGSLVYGLDIMAAPIYRDSFRKMLQTGQPVTSGPNKLAALDGYGIISWFPIILSNDTSNTQTKERCYGFALAMIEINRLLLSTNASRLVHDYGLDYAMWFTAPESPQPTVIGTSATGNANGDGSVPLATVLAEGRRMQLPIAQEGRSSYFAIFPRSGPASRSMSTSLIVTVAVVVFVATIVVVVAFYAVLFLLFLMRHRHAPRRGGAVYMAVVTMRGLQPMVDRSPAAAMNVSDAFVKAVTALASSHGCYAVSTLGDRSLYIVAASAEPLFALAKEVAMSDRPALAAVSVSLACGQGLGMLSSDRHGSVALRDIATETPKGGGGELDTPTSASRHNLNTSVMTRQSHGSTTIVSEAMWYGARRATIAIHAVRRGECMSVYDADKDAYFYGNSAQLALVCGVADECSRAAGGEVGWSAEVSDAGSLAMKKKAPARSFSPTDDDTSAMHYLFARGNRIVRDGIRIANLAEECSSLDAGDEEENKRKQKGEDEEETDDPALSMTLFSDVYVKRMAAVVAAAERHQMRKVSRGSKGIFGQFGSKGAAGGNKANPQANTKAGEQSNTNTTNKVQFVGGGIPSKGSDSFSSATSVSRNATLLHIALLGSAAATAASDNMNNNINKTSTFNNNNAAANNNVVFMRDDTNITATASFSTAHPLDVVRRAVASQRGTIVSSHGDVIVAAFNLLKPCRGHHQVAAAETVMALRRAFAPQQQQQGCGGVWFVCSLHHGRVRALVADDGALVMCGGRVVAEGRRLLDKAIAMGAMGRAVTESVVAASSAEGGVGGDNVVSIVSADGDAGGAGGSATIGSSSFLARCAFDTAKHCSDADTTAAAVFGSALPSTLPELSSGADLGAALLSPFDQTANGLCLLTAAHAELTMWYELEGVGVTRDEDVSDIAAIGGVGTTAVGSSLTAWMRDAFRAFYGLPNLTAAPSFSPPAKGGAKPQPLLESDPLGTTPSPLTSQNKNTKAGDYDCDASNASSNRIIYRLVYDKREDGGAGAAADGGTEWMYSLEEGEKGSPFADVNAVLGLLMVGRAEEACALWRDRVGPLVEGGGGGGLHWVDGLERRDGSPAGRGFASLYSRASVYRLANGALANTLMRIDGAAQSEPPKQLSY